VAEFRSRLVYALIMAGLTFVIVWLVLEPSTLHATFWAGLLAVLVGLYALARG
jgi:hypothetical protein